MNLFDRVNNLDTTLVIEPSKESVAILLLSLQATKHVFLPLI
jgi:hypothetical protein